MKNQLFILRIILGLLSIVASQYVSANPGPSHGKFITSPPSITNTTICNNQLPYLWNGINCLTAGTYTATLITGSGADSTAMLNLSVINVGISVSNAIICDNQLPYTWNGHSYTGSGTYSVTLTSSSGCDSVPILSLTVNHTVTSTTNVNICNNQLPYAWNGNSYTAAGNYSITLTSAAGCDSVATLQLSSRPLTSGTTNMTICASQLPYHWNGNVYNTQGTYQVVLNGSNGCDSVALLHLFTIPVSTSFSSATVCSNQLPYSWNGQQYSIPGNHAVHLTAASGCDSIATLTLTIKAVTQSSTNINICNGQLPYSWNGNIYSAPGVYNVTLSGSNGCDSIASLHLTAVQVLSSTSNTTVCFSQLPYTWNGNNYSTGGNYSSAFVTAAGCDSIANLVLSIETPQIVTHEITLCSNQLPYTWNGHIFTAAGTFPIQPPVVVDSCHSIDSVKIVVNTTLPGYTTASVCNNHLPYTWNGINYSASGTYSINLTSSTGCDSTAILNLSVNPVLSGSSNVSICSNQLPYSWNGSNYIVSGTYVRTLTSAAGCDSLAILHLQVNPVHASTTSLVVCNSQLPYNWNGQTYTGAGIYQLALTGSGGCDSLATLNLGVQPFLTSTTNLHICNAQLPYTWNGNTYNNAGIYSDSLLSAGGCDSIATLNLVVNNIMTGDTTIYICNTQLPYSWNGQFYSAAGNYTVMLMSTGGCDSVATIHLAVHAVAYSNTLATICNNQLPYSWNGNSYPVAGNYPVTLTGSSGCDSIATLQLVVTNILTSSTDITVCNAQLPYHWNGQDYTLPGTYSVTVTSPGGCDSVPVLILTVVPFVTSITNVSICNNLLPYSWSGHAYTAAGAYTDTLQSIAGCDSLATLNLFVKPLATSTTSISTCSNQLPYNWNGQVYNGSGNYSVILTGSNGCDSVAGLRLTVLALNSSNTVLSICSNQLPYSWNANSYPVAGTYTATLTGSQGCDSVATLVLQVKPVTSSNTTISICSNQLPYSWNSQQFLTAGTFTVVLQNASACDSIAILHLFVNPVLSSNTSAHTCSNQLPYNWNGQTYTTAGIHTVILNTVAGCDSLATLYLTINAVVNSFTQATTCANQLPFNWNGQLYNSSGTYTTNLTSWLGCDSIAKLQLTVHPVATSSSNVQACSAQLPYNWNGQSYITAGAHSVILTGATGCDSIATLNLAIQSSPAMPAVTSPLQYCQYETTTALSAVAADSSVHLLWYNSPAGGTGSPSVPVPSSLVPGTYNFYVSQAGSFCEGPRAHITVTVNSKPDFPDKTARICFGSTANLPALYALGGYQVNWMNNGLAIAAPVSAVVAGMYQFIAVSAAGCADTARVTLVVQPQLIAAAGPDANVEPNIPYQLTGSGGGSYEWSPANYLNNYSIANPLATINEDRRFILVVKDAIGCRAADTVNLRVLNGPTFYVPTAFTPNGDGLNDIFRPTPVGIATLDYFRVYNRYGELVYQTSEPEQGWDGIYKGVRQNTGNFVWWVKGTDRKGQVKLMRGNVVLIR